jgi:hypothetical protein
VKIADGMLEAAADAIRPDLEKFKAMPFSRPMVEVANQVAQHALEAAFATMPQGFCTKTQYCRLTDGHEGGCER